MEGKGEIVKGIKGTSNIANSLRLSEFPPSTRKFKEYFAVWSANRNNWDHHCLTLLTHLIVLNCVYM